MNVSPKLLPLLRDPQDQSKLELEGDALVSATSRRRFPIVHGIPVLLDETEVGAQNVRLRDMYRWMAKGFDIADSIGNFFSFGAMTRARRGLASELELKPGDRCLYTSIGTGLDLPFIAKRVPLDAIELVGLDLSPEMLARCQRKLRRWPGPMLVQANAERLPFADHSFDVVFHLGGINLFDRPAQAVREMVRVAKPGTFVLIADETPEFVRDHYQKQNPFTRKACAGISTDFNPSDWVPADAREVTRREIFGGRGYAIRFRTAAP